MSELEHLIRETTELRLAGKSFLLATVVEVRGSSYRRAGARMVMADDRWIAGCVSGGWLEGDIVRRGAYRTRQGVPAVVTYDSTSDDELGWGFGLGCNGVVDVLIERVEPDAALDPLRFAACCIGADRRGALVTVFRAASPGLEVGARLALCEVGASESTLPSGAARDALEAVARTALDARAGGRRAEAVVSTAHGATLLVEVFEPPPRLFVCGTGHDALPLVALARSMGWGVTVAAAHPSVRTTELFAPLSGPLLAGPADALGPAVARHARALAVVMSHDYERDKRCVGALLGTSVEYIGVLGPALRTDRILSDLAREGAKVTTESRRRIHAPVGLDLGAETPQEIALAIVAEVQGALTHSSSRSLRERTAPIHGTSVAAPHQPIFAEITSPIARAIR